MTTTKRCPKCATTVTVAPGETPSCPRCGFGRSASTGGRGASTGRPHVGGPAVGPSPAGVLGRGVAVFGILGLALGVAMLIVLGALGFFSDEGELGDAFAGAIFLIVSVVFVYLSGILLAALVAMHAARALSGRGVAGAVGGVVGAVGHLVLVLVFLAVITVGVLAMEPDGEGATDDGEESPTDLSAFADFAFGLLPAGLAGAAAGAVHWTPRPGPTAAAAAPVEAVSTP